MDGRPTFEDSNNVYLAHYGVFGMKWGVRKAESQARIARAHREDTSTNDYVLKKGQNIQRLTFTTGKGQQKTEDDPLGFYDHRPYEERVTDIKKHGDTSFNKIGHNTDGVSRTYVSINPEDNNIYKNKYHKTGAVINMQMSSVSDLKIAGGKKVIEEILRIDGDNKTADKLSSTKLNNAKDLHNWLNKNARYEAENYYSVSDPTMGGMYTNEVVKRLRKQGYSGMKDLWDGMSYATIDSRAKEAGKRETKKLLKKLGDQARDPTIIFEPKKNLRIDSVTMLRDDKGNLIER